MSKIVEVRIADYAFESLDEDQQQHLKELCRRYRLTQGYNQEYSYHWIWFTKEAWLMVNLADPNFKYLVGHVYE